MWGMQRTLVDNLLRGVSEGFVVELEIIGVGYRAAAEGRTLNLQMGYSHEINYPIPEGIEIKCERPTAVAVSGMDRQQVGQVAAEIRSFRKPEPYKGKGNPVRGRICLPQGREKEVISMAKREALIKRRARRVRHHLRAAGRGRPRLSVYRSNKHIYVQVIDDVQGVTLASASTPRR